jgi:hypothetical protein
VDDERGDGPDELPGGGPGQGETGEGQEPGQAGGIGAERTEEQPAGPGRGAEAPRAAARPRVLRPWEALELLDRQWEDRTPVPERRGSLGALCQTVPEDPEGWDYLGAMTGAPAREVALACGAWLEAQLAADATAVGLALRPRVYLVPAGGLWHVVRGVGPVLLAFDGPGLPTPGAAVLAAARRYRADLARDAARRAEAVLPAEPGAAEPGASAESSA